jgi:hypothetical protein
MRLDEATPFGNLDAMAEQAFEAHAALVRAESITPGLAGNPYWQALRDAAFARFSAVYGKAAPL